MLGVIGQFVDPWVMGCCPLCVSWRVTRVAFFFFFLFSHHMSRMWCGFPRKVKCGQIFDNEMIIIFVTVSVVRKVLTAVKMTAHEKKHFGF